MKIIEILKNRAEDDEFIFKINTGLKFSAISVCFLLMVLLFTYLLLNINLIYFVAHGYPGASQFRGVFFDFVYSSLIDEVPYVIIAIIFVFCLGYYLASIMLRPFNMISKYCEDRLSNNAHYYSPDFFSDLKLLTTFSVFFFSRIDEAQEKGKLHKVEIPYDFTRIHKPVFEKNFFFNYFFIIAIFALLASVGILLLNSVVREQIYDLAQKFLARNQNINKGMRYFIEEQFSVADIGVYFMLSFHMSMYFLLGLHLYSKVSAPAFAIFATMRSFLKGNYHNRVHLIGFSYLRNDCRKINKYLDHIQKNLVEKTDQNSHS